MLLLIPACDAGSPVAPRPSVRLDVIESLLHTSAATGRTTLSTRVMVRNPTFISVEPILCSFRLQRIVGEEARVTLAQTECGGNWSFVVPPHTDIEHSFSVTLPAGDSGAGSEYVIRIPIILEGERASRAFETERFTPVIFRGH
jgi:hypothetical protein